MSIEQILSKHHILTDEQLELLDYSSKCMDELYELLYTQMPYGTAKARTGDPNEWILTHVRDTMGW